VTDPEQLDLAVTAIDAAVERITEAGHLAGCSGGSHHGGQR